MIFQVGSILLRRIAVCAAGALFVLACGQGAALRSAQEAGETVKAQTQPRAESGNQNSTGVVKEISLAELSAMNKASTKGTASGTGTTSGKVARPLPQGAATSGTAGTATRSSGATANSSGMSVPAPRTTVPGSESSTGVSRTSARGVGPDLGVTKDITGLDWVVLQGGSGKVLTQAMISQRCRRYIVKGSFDLGGKTLRMPYGSVLDLENGELRNGGLVMDKTRVTPIYGISKETRISKVKVSGEYYETLVDLWGVHEDPVFPWDTSAPKKVYVVDLKKFGITPGYQRKGADGHYTARQYDLMYQNGVGFTEAIQWAYKNGYDGIRFPKNDYCFTPRTTKNEKPQEGPIVLVQDLDKFDIDFGGAIYYLILDSKKKSKYYTLNLDKPYAQGGTLFFIAACINLQIHDAKMVGDRSLRDYDEGAEKNLENSRAFALSAYCQNIRIHHMDLCDFMADGISVTQFGNWYRNYDSNYSTPVMTWSGKAQYGKFVEKEGQILIDSENKERCTISNYLKLTNHYRKGLQTIERIAEKRVFSINNNLGYTRLINNYHNIDILTFNEKESTEQPLRIIHSSYLDYFSLLPNETGIKIQSWYDEGVPEGGIQHSATISDLISGHCIIENCQIHDNHRGGITGGSNYNTIRNCSFSKSNTSKNYHGTVIPIFMVGATNYHINYEDSYSKGLDIYQCSFNRTHNSIGRLFFGVYTLSFHDNVSDAGVVLYNNLLCDVYHNSFKTAGFGISEWRHSSNDDVLKQYGFHYLMRILYFHDNLFGQNSVYKDQYRTYIYQYDNKPR